MNMVFYIAFIVEREIHQRGRVVVEAGIDLLAGPYPSRGMAQQAIRATCRQHPRLAAFAGLAAVLMSEQEKSPVRIEVLPVTEDAVARYNARHQAALPWPPPVLAPGVTGQLDRVPRPTTPHKARKGGAHASA